ncbi:MAG: hypothetical protein Q8N03_03545 [Ignavibacteria bacterium]|nr:hypothetical protein [Ignavibacteria bacterium]MDP3831283.1 hypothetical protein [Ignavibacteriaceae bacterium]
MLKKYLIIVSTIFLIFNGKLFANDATFDSLVNKGIREIYNIKFEDAEVTFRQVIASYPEHPAGRFFLAMIDWWKILLDLDEEKYDDILFQKLEDVIFQCDNILEKEPKNVDALFFKGGAIGFRGRLRAVRESWLKAADDGRQALPIVEYAYKLDPENKDVELGFGIYNYYADVIPDRYPLIKPLMFFFPSGDKVKGIQQLNNTANFGKYAKFEAKYFLMTLYNQFENDPYKAYEYALSLSQEFPDNPNFQRWLGRLAVRKGSDLEYFTIFSDVFERCKNGLPGYNTKTEREAAYYKGIYYKNIRSADSAKVYLEQSEKLSREIEGKSPSGFLVNSVLYLAYIDDLQGRREDAILKYKDVLNMKEFSQSHFHAKLYLERPYTE